MHKYILFILLFIFNNTLYATIGKLTSLKGEVFIQNSKNDTKAKKRAKIGAAIQLKDIITTKDNSKALLALHDDTLIAIGKNTTIKVEQFLYNPKINSKNELKVNFFNGVFRTISGQIGKLNKKRFNIDTPNSSIGIRGTTFLVTIDNEYTKVGVEKGKVYLNSEDNKTINIDTNTFITFINKTGEYFIEPLKEWLEGQKIKTDLEQMVTITNSLPSWIKNPKVKNSISAVGIASYNKHGMQIMLNEATIDAKAKLAGKIQTQIQKLQKRTIQASDLKDKTTLTTAFTQASKETINDIPLSGARQINMYQAKDGTLYIHMIIEKSDIKEYFWEKRRSYAKQMLNEKIEKKQIKQNLKNLSYEIKNFNFE